MLITFVSVKPYSHMSLVILTIVLLNIFMYHTPVQFYIVNLQHSNCKPVFSIKAIISVDPDKMATSEYSKNRPVC